MAKNTKKGSTKAARKQAGIQRGIGHKTAKELQDAAAAIKAQATAKSCDVVCVPQPAKAASKHESGSIIPDNLSDGCSSDCNPPTPDIVPASPNGLSTGPFETDGAASSAFSTSNDEGPAPSEAGFGQEEVVDDLEQVLQEPQEALNLSSTALEATELTPTCAETVTDHRAAESPAPIYSKPTWELSPEAQAHAEAEERFSGAWTFEFSPDMALCEAGLAQLLPLPTPSEDDRALNCTLDFLPVKTPVAAAEGADATPPPPGLGNLQAQDFAEADEACTGPDLWTCDFITATAGADMTELRPLRASDAADTNDRVPVSPLVAQQVHAATAAKKEAAEPGALVPELTGKEEKPDTHKPKGQPSAQHLITAPPAAPPCGWPAALALHACSHLQAASAHRWLQSRKLACVRLPLQLVAAAGIEATALTAAVCQFAMSCAC